MRPPILLTTLLAGGLLLGGCGAEPSVTVLGSAPATPAAPAASAAPSAEPAERVEIMDFDYAPRRLRVPPGTRVEWPNRDAANHTVSFRRNPPGDLGDVDRGETLTARFGRPGRYEYVCVYHPAMRGVVVVR